MSPGSSAAAPARARPNPHLSDDERLGLLVGRGDQDALGVLYERYHQGLFRYARSLLRNESDAADATQEAFVKALTALRAARRDAPLRPWLFKIVHNEAM